ncbi:bcl-2-like protein 12 [Thalassophryne amazonica]|uniref:bcl-2-like protein 12 n=1 Tax=Thalassophryne amazonica TaxID=390379 RepID=UPI001470BF5E|nr:bcl-2-like protein 12 [Thalassophryne amazonica]
MESTGRLPSSSSISSISLMEAKAETHRVLQAFVSRTLTLPLIDRPGNIGGAYKDHNRFRAKPQPKPKDGWDSQAEDVISGEEKKSGFTDFIKSLPRPSSRRRQSKNTSLDKDKGSKPPNYTDQLEDEVLSHSSTSEDEKKPQKKRDPKKIRKKISEFFKKKMEKENDKEKKENASHPARPSRLELDNKPEPLPPIVSPNHPPEFYEEVAERLDKLVHRSASIRTPSPASVPCDKEVVVQQLVQVLSLEGDVINTKIQADPFLRSTLTRLSYASFAKLLDTFSNSQVPDSPTLQPAASPTLQRMAVTMEVSRRIVTATGTQRLQGYAECYMDKFAPWVKRQGGWENIVDLESVSEYD